MEKKTLQAIQTKFLAPTNCRPARIKATAAAGSITLGCDGLSDGKGEGRPWASAENHRAAAEALAHKFEWDTYGHEMWTGCLPSGDYAHVFTDGEGRGHDS